MTALCIVCGLVTAGVACLASLAYGFHMGQEDGRRIEKTILEIRRQRGEL